MMKVNVSVMFPCLAAFAAAGAAGAEVDPGFQPIPVRVELTSRRVRPGDPLGATFVFRNGGTRVARGNYKVFVHFEYPEASCGNIKFQYDHDPVLPTSAWPPGKEVRDGPYAIPTPGDAVEGRYHLHVGVFASGNGRLSERYFGTIELAEDAPAAEDIRPEPLSAAEVAARRKRLAARLRNPQTIETPAFRFSIDSDQGAFELLDRRTGVLWTSDAQAGRLGSVVLRRDTEMRTVPLAGFDQVEKTGGGLLLRKALSLDGKTPSGVTLVVEATPVQVPVGLRLRYRAERVPGCRWSVDSVTLLENALGVTDADAGASVLPYRLGELVSAREGMPGIRRYRTHDNASLALYGAVKRGSALLVAWTHPGVRLEVKTTWPDHPMVPGRALNTMSLVLGEGARELTLHPLGSGGYVEIAKAYRELLQQRGRLPTWAEKRKRHPTVDRMFGAADFKPFVFSRIVPSSRFNKTGKDIVHLGYTFEEAARVAEHLHRDLGIDKAMYVLAGWIHRGYDNQHPDILPACPECGGNEKLAECAKRVKACGFLFGLHDNYQDMYADAPSWDVKYLNKRSDGAPKKGGNWAGGQAWQVCAVEQVALAARPRNLPAVERLFGPTIYFIDTVFAWPLVTCDDPNHPMTRVDDMRWKSRLCDLARKHFGLFGSEEGREWAVPHADYFEGLLSHKVSSGRNSRGYSRSGGGRVIPLYELIYGDCINLYTHQGDRARPNRAKYILDCIVYAENPLYGFGPHLYFKKGGAGVLPVGVEVVDFRQVGKRKFSATYRWSPGGKIEADYKCFVHFTHPRGDRNREHIAFQDDHELQSPTGTWKVGRAVLDGPRTVEVPAKFSGRIRWYIGLTHQGRRALLQGQGDGRSRLLLGTLDVRGDSVRFEPAKSATSAAVFARADGGWGAALNPTDRLIKNTYEVTSWLNRITAETPMTDHRFLRPDGSVEYSAFGDVRIWVNYGTADYAVPVAVSGLDGLCDGDVVLPQYGFLAAGPTFAAFHATRFGSTRFAESALFTFRSLDERPLPRSDRVRVFHAFGPSRVRFAGQDVDVPR
ncbi:MAG: hypothetical protein GXP31_14105, partial [Kiritimatiellaeota bacterium]|nr:hypothetical protein [Kiritimatiellota bacterium]